MRTNLKFAVAILLSLVLPVAAGTSVAQVAQNVPVADTAPAKEPAAVQGGSGSAPAMPAGYTVIPPNDGDRADDQIVQLENLTVQSVEVASAGDRVATILASRDIGGGVCRQFESIEARTSSVYPCPLAPSVLYQISVQSDTILLFRDRSRASIGEFSAGDRVNVFGFMDPGTSGIHALIVRDLDKPAASGYVQLNNVTVLSTPSAPVPPAVFRVARRGVEPCLSFASDVARGISAPCPMGIDVSASAEALTSPAVADLYRPFRQYYDVKVTAATQLLGFSRAPINLADIQPQDHVNVYGRYVPGTRTVEAFIVRDLSVSWQGAASLAVTVSDNRIVCVTTPCGQISGMRVDVHWLDNEGDDTPALVTSQTTVNGQATFRNLKPGLYLVTASGAGYPSVGARTTLRQGEASRVSLFTSKEERPGILLLAPNGGEALVRGSSYTVRWRPDPTISNAADIYLVANLSGCINLPPNGGACLAVVDPEYTVARSVAKPAGDGTMTYDWTVPNTFEKILLQDGAYYLKVCYAGTKNCDVSDRPFHVTASAAAPKITSIAPRSGAAGTKVALQGSFAGTGNYVYFGGYIVASNLQSDGKTLAFTVPDYVSPCPADPYGPQPLIFCAAIAMQLPAGEYPVTVQTPTGKSNAATFRLEGGPVTATPQPGPTVSSDPR